MITGDVHLLCQVSNAAFEARKANARKTFSRTSKEEMVAEFVLELDRIDDIDKDMVMDLIGRHS